MKRRHQFAYYCTLLLPIGALMGVGAGNAIGFPTVVTVFGSASAVAAAWALVQTTPIRDRA